MCVLTCVYVNCLVDFCFFFSKTAKKYWKEWQEFEVRHGNEDTFREMLRIKRSVQAQYNTQVKREGGREGGRERERERGKGEE